MESLDVFLEEEPFNEGGGDGGTLHPITDAFAAADLFTQLKIDDRFHPNRSVSSEGSVKIGLGRGTFLKKSRAD